MKTANNDFGLIGLAVMGQNLVLNIESRGHAVSVFNRSADVTAGFVAAHAGKRLFGATTLPEFVASLSRPRKIMLMVKAGAAVKRMDNFAITLAREPGERLAAMLAASASRPLDVLWEPWMDQVELKFSLCLPEVLAHAALVARLTDSRGARRALAEPMRRFRLATTG